MTSCRSTSECSLTFRLPSDFRHTSRLPLGKRVRRLPAAMTGASTKTMEASWSACRRWGCDAAGRWPAAKAPFTFPVSWEWLRSAAEEMTEAKAKSAVMASAAVSLGKLIVSLNADWTNCPRGIRAAYFLLIGLGCFCCPFPEFPDPTPDVRVGA